MATATMLEHRADRKVELAHHDEQHHARGHDRDGRGLHQQRPQIPRRQEGAAEQSDIGAQDAAVDVEADPDRRPARRPCRACACRSRWRGRSAVTAPSFCESRIARWCQRRCSSAFSPRSLASVVKKMTAPFIASGAAMMFQFSTEGKRLAAGGNRSGLHAGAGLFLADPAGVDHLVEVVLGDRVRREQDGVHLDALLARR